jgi:hypothetical protein
MFAILHGLKRPNLASQNAIWEALPLKYAEALVEMEAITVPSDNYAKYWDDWKGTRPPAIPFFGTFLMYKSV